MRLELERQREFLRPDAPDLTVVVPTYNEFDNIDELVRRVSFALEGVAWELIVVDDDSPDGTALRARQLGRLDPRVRVIQRFGRRGVSSACIEGMMASTSPLVAVIDADLQHDPALLAEMVWVMAATGCELVSASRYREGGDLGGWSAGRARISRLATGLVHRLTGVALTDPMSGFFMVRRGVIDETARRLSGRGFKILLDLVLTADRPLVLAEVACRFDVRRRGESKLSLAVAAALLLMLAEKGLQRLGRRLAGPRAGLRLEEEALGRRS